jgi:hypothetical protein
LVVVLDVVVVVCAVVVEPVVKNDVMDTVVTGEVKQGVEEADKVVVVVVFVGLELVVVAVVVDKKPEM